MYITIDTKFKALNTGGSKTEVGRERTRNISMILMIVLIIFCKSKNIKE